MNWISRHERALDAVTPTKTRSFFRKCGVPKVGKGNNTAMMFAIQNAHMVSLLLLLASDSD